MDLYTIYVSENHTYLNKWIAISNPEEDYNKITGYLLISVQVLHENDEAYNLS